MRPEKPEGSEDSRITQIRRKSILTIFIPAKSCFRHIFLPKFKSHFV